MPTPRRTQRILAAVLLLLCSLAALSVSAEAKVHHHTWDIAYHYKSLDCVEKLAVTINGESPGPTIHATQGDTIVVTVHNKLETENTGIHWHGIRQIGSPWADGTVGVTQCPILPGDTFTYRFVVDRPGTYFYHAHYGMQRVAGLDGMLVVSAPDGVAEPFTYDEERTILLMDWWHKSVYEQAVGLASDPLKFVGEPQSLLINGRGVFEPFHCSRAPQRQQRRCLQRPRSAGCAPPPLFTAVPGKTYRLRVGSLTSLSALNFAIEGHSMTPLHLLRRVLLGPGQGRPEPVPELLGRLPRRGRERNTTSAMAILSYAGNDPRAPPPTPRPEGPAWDDVTARVEQSRSLAVAHPDHVLPVPPRPDRALLLLNTQNRIGGHTKWAINGVSLAFPATPYLVSMKRGLQGAYDARPPPETYDFRSYDIERPPPANGTVASAVYRLALGSVVDLVLQNTVALNKKSETHPWHLHGHDFWVLAYGDGKFDPERDTARFNLRDPVMKNTVALHPKGWTAVRFVADNPGVWLFHCHIEAHVYMGMAVVFEEGVDKVGRLPKSIMGCGRSRTLP
ncbi:unnamed protein product [Miscanthus lutarioriparius]|uniref:L-ascorbate oxidase n=1 Tax=Miscanthus lutarioriparius TaxID=422564 RepID=A0A811PH89_9POAL|nr:unnamed protein product [Miscanthus lutarioriparius]